MRRRVVLAVCFFGVFAGCSNPIQEDLLNYINNELPKIVESENAVITAWDSVSGSNYSDDYTMYETLTELIIPTYREFLTGMETITLRLKTKEVRALNEKYIEAVSTQNNAFLLLQNILETQDGSKIIDFNERLDKGRKLVREWQIEIQELCKKSGVKFNPEW
jgi:hypothetical protein